MTIFVLMFTAITFGDGGKINQVDSYIQGYYQNQQACYGAMLAGIESDQELRKDEDGPFLYKLVEGHYANHFKCERTNLEPYDLSQFRMWMN